MFQPFREFCKDHFINSKGHIQPVSSADPEAKKHKRKTAYKYLKKLEASLSSKLSSAVDKKQIQKLNNKITDVRRRMARIYKNI